MADTESVDESVIQMPPRLPEAVTVSGDFRMTANEMRRLKEVSGRTMTELMGEEADDADRVQAMVWLKLRREGHDPTWDQAGDVGIDYAAPVPDPTSDEHSKSSPDSAGSGE
jgi:hypothetical protein